FDDDDLSEVLSWPELEHLTHLELEGYSLTAAGVQALAAAHLPQLRSLVFVDPRRDRDRFWEPLLNATWLPQLETFAAEEHALPAELVGVLGEKLRPRQLRSFRLTGVGLDDGAVGELARSGILSTVMDLRLVANGITRSGAELLRDALPAAAYLLL